ncbi:MAG: flagellar basal body-associated FliL family protein [Defluviicoccus sp.]
MDDAASEQPALAAGRASRLRTLIGRLRGRLNRRVAFAATAAIVVVTAGLAMLLTTEDRSAVTIELGGPNVYYPLPEFMADLKPQGGRTRHVRLAIVLQVPQERVAAIEAKQVEILAAIQAHLRDQEHKSLVGTAGADRLRADLREIINRALGQTDVRVVLFTHFLLD